MEYIAFIGDIHGHYDWLFRLMENVKDVVAWVQVGDLGIENKEYPVFPKPLYFISGNHDNYDEIEKLHATPEYARSKNLYHIPNGCVYPIENLNFAALGGNYSPKYFYRTRADQKGLRRRHYVEAEVEACKALTNVQIFLTHEAADPYVVKGRNAGRPEISEILKVIKPSYYFFGHHHYFGKYEYEKIESYGLNFGAQDIILMDTLTLKVKKF